MDVEQLGHVLGVGALILLLGVAAVRLSLRTGLPSLLLYLGLGLALSASAGGGLAKGRAETGVVLGYAALVLILAEGGLTTRWAQVRPAMVPAVMLATAGTAVSIAVTAVPVHYLLGRDWPFSLLVGAVVSSTDAAAVFSVLRRVPLPKRLAGVLEAESGLNDAPVVIAVESLTRVVTGHEQAHPLELVGGAVLELVLGAAAGLAVGFLGAWLMRRVALPSSGLYPIAALALAVGAYGAGAWRGSGFLATYLACLVLGNSRLPHRAAVTGFAEGLGWLAQIGLFVLLGLLATPTKLPGALAPALVVGLALTLVARPMSVAASALLSRLVRVRLPWRHQVMLSWAGLRGAVPIVLATVPMVNDAETKEALYIFNLVFVLVVIFTLLQAPTLPLVARWLRLGKDEAAATELDVEVSPLGAMSADVLQVRVGERSRLHGVEIFELRLPAGANVTLVIRDGTAIVPTGRTVLRHGDDLLVVTGSPQREAVERRLAAVSSDGKLAGWSLPGPEPRT